jgi:hypothetical protein
MLVDMADASRGSTGPIHSTLTRSSHQCSASVLSCTRRATMTAASTAALVPPHAMDTQNSASRAYGSQALGCCQLLPSSCASSTSAR